MDASTAAMLAALAVAEPAPSTDPGLTARLDAVVDQAIADERIVGAVVLVAEDGKLVYRRAAGHSDRQAGVPMEADAIFRLASVTKPIVSAAALALVDQGKLSLDDPVTRHVPEFRPKLADGTEPTITVRQLMTHTAGLSYRFLEGGDGPYNRANVSDGLDQPGLPFEANLDRILSVPLLFEPGTAWNYSLATDVLGEVVARAGGSSLPDMVQRLVTTPLGMDETAFEVVDPSRLAIAYAAGEPRPVPMAEEQVVANVRFVPSRIFDQQSYPSGGAGMAGSADDILAFLETLRQGGSPILTEETVDRMSTNAIDDLVVTIRPPGWGFGLGMAVLKDPAAAKAPHSVGTWQWGGVYGHTWFVDPERELTVVALTNTAIAGNAGAVPCAIRDAVYGVSMC